MITIKVINKINQNEFKKYDFDQIINSGIMSNELFPNSGLWPVDKNNDFFTLTLHHYNDAIEHIERFKLRGRKKKTVKMVDYTFKMLPKMKKKMRLVHGKKIPSMLRKFIDSILDEM
jgi:hypothetical protein